MCGIGGILRVWPAEQRDLALRTAHAQSIPEAWLDILDESIRHRGPDGHGRFRDRVIRSDGCVVDVALVHRRLSIIDHAGGAQPMVLRFPQGAPSASSGVSAQDRAQDRPIPGRWLSAEEVAAHTRHVLAEAHVAPGAGSHPPPSSTPTPVALARPIPGRWLSAEEVAAHTRHVLAEAHVAPGAGSADPELALGAPWARVAVVFNGCIYNHRELRAELQRYGHEFTSDHSDTEVLVHGWRAWGGGLFDRLDGMHALAIWDGAAGDCILARDTFGEKPMYHLGSLLQGPGCFAFASTVPGLLRLDPVLLGESRPGGGGGDEPGFWVRPWIKHGWNQGLMPTGRVKEVVGGSRWVVPSLQSDDPSHGLSWAPHLHEYLNPTHVPLSAERAESLLHHAVASRLEADVPLGCFLSGGLDSAIIAAIAVRERPDMRAFTVRMPDASYDESDLAQATAKAIGVKHAVLDCDPHPANDLLALIHQIGLPFGDSSLLPTHWVSRAARREVKVALAGDGGDEMFLGYDRHRAVPWLSRLSRLPPETLRALADALPIGAGGGRRSKRDRLARLVNAAAADGYKELVAIFPAPLDGQLGIARADRPSWGRMPHYGMTRPCDDLDFLWKLALRFDRMFYLTCDLLRKTDTASMAVPLEVRSPMLQTDLARAAINAPISSLMPRGERKGLLRRVARKYLPAEIVDRPKMGFAIPIGEWFRTDYGGLRTMLLDHLNSTEPFGPPSLGIDLNMRFVRQMLDEHLGTGPGGMVKRDHSPRLYMLLVLSIWAKWVGGLRA